MEKEKWDYSEKRKRRPGRPKTPASVEALICQLARENIWGYKKIQGELKKLGIEISKTSVANIVRRNGLPPSPDRKGLTWREFLSRHAEVFLCADLLTKEIWTFKGLQRAFVFFVLDLQTRKVLLAGATFSPTNQWIKQQIRRVIWECEDQGIDNKIPSEYNSKVEIAKLKIAGETHVSQIHRKEFLGGLLKSYYRKVA